MVDWSVCFLKAWLVFVLDDTYIITFDKTDFNENNENLRHQLAFYVLLLYSGAFDVASPQTSIHFITEIVLKLRVETLWVQSQTHSVKIHPC